MNIAQEFTALFTLHGFLALVVLSLLELVLGIDNIIFISLVIAKLPKEKSFSARITGLTLALVMRILMLFGIVYLSKITNTLFTISHFDVSVRDLLFFIGGAYLLWNTASEMREHLNGGEKEKALDTKPVIYRNVVMQIILVDMLFSFDSIFTAIGLIQNFVIMVVAVSIGMVFMIWVSGKTAEFINRHPTVKTLALCFIMVIGFLLLSSAFHYNIPKAYFYVALGFALVVELLNMRMRRKKGNG
jgi:predicted tellurium resistance membrane protein TerC